MAEQTNQTTKKRHLKRLKWGEIHMQMAEYLHENIEKYQAALHVGKKIRFLRTMRDTMPELKNCDDVQLKNGWMNFLKKYEAIKVKLNSSGFGIDPDVDSSLEKGWIKKECPYYELVDAVLGTRPNVTPPFIVQSTEVGAIGEDISIDFHEHVRTEMDEMELPDDMDNDIPLMSDDPRTPTPVGEPASVAAYVKGVFKGIGQAKSRTSPKTAMGTFAELMGLKVSEQTKVEREKLDLEERKFKSQQDFELLKIQSEATQQREQREHEMEKIKMAHDNEIKKMELLIELEKLKQSRKD